MVLSYNLYNEVLLIHTKTKLRGVLFETQRKKINYGANKLQERKFLL